MSNDSFRVSSLDIIAIDRVYAGLLVRYVCNKFGVKPCLIAIIKTFISGQKQS